MMTCHDVDDQFVNISQMQFGVMLRQLVSKSLRDTVHTVN
jgi:hypothetical protein